METAFPPEPAVVREVLGPLAEVRANKAVGGGRGLYATQPIRAGTLIFQEEPIVPQPATRDEDPATGLPVSLPVAVAAEILRRSDAERDAIVTRAEFLYPRGLAELTPLALAKAREQHGGEGAGNLRYLAAQQQHARRPLAADEILEILMKIQLNAFCSGLYLVFSLVNHSAAPSATKFEPGSQGGASQTSSSFSELRAVRDIAAGEEITVSYLQPVERSWAAQQRAFEAQHFAALPPEAPYARELNAFASQEPDAQDRCRHAEEALDEAEFLLSSGRVGAAEALEQLEALFEDLAPHLHPRHLVLCRCNRLLAHACHRILAQDRLPAPEDQSHRRAGKGKDGTKKARRAGLDAEGDQEKRCGLVLLQVSASLEVRETQRLYLPSTHCEAGSTAHDLAQGLEFLLANAPALLPEHLAHAFPSTAAASRAEYAFRKEYEAVKALYEGAQGGGAAAAAGAGGRGPPPLPSPPGGVVWCPTGRGDGSHVAPRPLASPAPAPAPAKPPVASADDDMWGLFD